MVDAGNRNATSFNDTKKIIYESFKTVDNFMLDLEKLPNKDKLGFYDFENKKFIRFY